MAPNTPAVANVRDGMVPLPPVRPVMDGNERHLLRVEHSQGLDHGIARHVEWRRKGLAQPLAVFTDALDTKSGGMNPGGAYLAGDTGILRALPGFLKEREVRHASPTVPKALCCPSASTIVRYRTTRRSIHVQSGTECVPIIALLKICCRALGCHKEARVPGETVRGAGMLTLVARRLAIGIGTLLGVSVIIFVATEILPGDVATAILGQSATEENTAAIRAQLGLDRPPHERYLDWLVGFVQGDLGTSLGNRRPIAPQVGFRLENTLFLAGLAALVAIPLSVGLGLLSAIRQDTPVDRGISVSSLMAISVPEFFIGYVLIIIFAVTLRWFPSLSNVSDQMTLGERLDAMVLPIATLTLVTLAHMMRMTRAAVIAVMSSSYVEMAHLKGVRYWRIVVQHALPNVWSPIITVIMLNMAYLIVGVVVVEVVFTYPGMGQYMVDSVSKRDVPVVQACVMIFASVWILLTLIADISSILANPRLRHPK